jgi:protein ImuB
MRIACVFVPQLALQAVLRRTPEARGGPVAVLEAAVDGKSRSRGAQLGFAQRSPFAGGLGPSQGPKKDSKRIARVTEISPEARREGVRAGMTGAQAAAVCAGLRLLHVTAADRESASAALADVGFAFAPRIERDGAERIFFESEDLARLYPAGETAIAQAMQAAAARVGLGVRVAIAGAKGVARLATRAHELALVPTAAGPARAALASIPVEVLCEGDAALAAAFRRWGLRTAGDVAALPVDAVGLRLGPVGARACRLARGLDDEPFVPRLPDDALEEAIELDYPVAELEPFSFVLRGLIDRALGRLRERSLACAGLTLRLTLDPRGADVRSVPIAAPTGDAATLLQLARLDLARRPPAAPIVGARLLALPARVRATQLDMLRPAGPAPDRLAATIARLAALVGPENVGAPAIEDTWREEVVGVTSYEPARPDERLSLNDGPLTLSLSSTLPLRGARANGFTDPSAANETQASEARLTIRRRRPPEEIEMLLNRQGPAAFRGRETTARVLVAAGPYRLSGEWWQAEAETEGASEGTERGWSRAYWDVHASDGAVYRVHQDRRDGRWYLDGYYD